MATNSDREPTAGPEPGCSSSQAQAALAGLDADRVTLAARVVTPWWYHPTLGAILAVIVASYALPLGYQLLPLLPGLLAMVFLVKAYGRRYGVSVISSSGPRTRRLQVAIAVTVVTTIAASLILNLAGASPWWTLVPMAVVFCAVIVIGRRYDEAVRAEVADGEAALTGTQERAGGITRRSGTQRRGGARS